MERGREDSSRLEPRGLRGKRVTVMGLGLFGGGEGAARWARARGAAVTITDLRAESVLAPTLASLDAVSGGTPFRFVLGRHDNADFEDTDLIIVNPGVPASAPHLERARAAGTERTTATALLLESSAARVVAVTGTNGKSSTVRFLSDLLGHALPADRRVLLGGNIGGSLLEEAHTHRPGDVMVLELSSYQLEHLPLDRRSARLDVAAITGIGVDHLERHGTVEEYRRAKRRILDAVAPGGIAILPESEPAAPGMTRWTHGVGAPRSHVHVQTDGTVLCGDTCLGNAHDLGVPGEYQRSNLSVALAAAFAMGAEPSALARAIPRLGGLPHRLEPVGELAATGHAQAAQVIDNGVSTTPESTLSALRSIDGPGVLVAGGQGKKGLEFDGLAAELVARDWTLVPFGAAAESLFEAAQAAGAATFGGAPWPVTAEEAARRATEAIRRTGYGTLLFSPACASFDGYPNFKVRAEAFRNALGLD